MHSAVLLVYDKVQAVGLFLCRILYRFPDCVLPQVRMLAQVGSPGDFLRVYKIRASLEIRKSDFPENTCEF